MLVSQWRLSLLISAISAFSVFQLDADSFDAINTDIYQSILSSLVDVNPADMPNAVRDIINTSATNKKNYSRLAEPAVFKSVLNRLQQNNNGKSALYYAGQFKRPLLLNSYSKFGSIVSSSANKAYSELLSNIQDPYRFQKIINLQQGSKIPFSIPMANMLLNTYTDSKFINYENCKFLLPNTKLSPNTLQTIVAKVKGPLLANGDSEVLVDEPEIRKKIIPLLMNHKTTAATQSSLAQK